MYVLLSVQQQNTAVMGELDAMQFPLSALIKPHCHHYFNNSALIRVPGVISLIKAERPIM